MKKFFILLFTLIIFTSLFFAYFLFLHKVSVNKIFIVNKGEVVSQISKNLKHENIISNSFLFDIYFKFFSDRNIKSGKYIFNGSFTIPEVSEILINNTESIVKTINLTIPEGWNKYDISQYLSEKTIYKYNDILDFIDNGYKKTSITNKYNFLNTDSVFNLEGYLYPDTYEIFENATLEDVFLKMLGNFKAKVIDKYNITDYNKLYSIIKMASVIEKEAKLDKDRAVVASVINNRLAIQMKLQMDSTVVYFTKNRDNEAIAEDKWTENDYNTYRKYGLPIGPISNPGDESINAVINPSNTNYYYFLNKDNGEAVFAETYEEHMINIQKYLR